MLKKIVITFFIIKYNLLINIYSQSFSFPFLKQLTTIPTSTLIYGNFLKMRVNKDYIIRLSQINRIDIWSTNNYTLIKTLKPSSDVLSNINDLILDFVLQPTNTDILGILFKTRFYFYSIVSNQLTYTYNNINGGYFYRVLISKKHIAFLYEDGFVYRYNRTSMVLKNKFDTVYNYNKPQGHLCENKINGTQVYIFYSTYNRLNIFRCEQHTTGNCAFVYQAKLYAVFQKKQTNRIVSNDDCSLVYSQADTYRDPLIINLNTNQSKSYFSFLEVIYSFSKFDQKSKYSMLIRSDGYIRVYDPNKAVVKSYSLTYGLSSLEHLDIYRNFVYFGLNSQIKAARFQCGSLKYMAQVNLCFPCSNICKSCNYLNGYCYQCINSSYNLLLNGTCMLMNTNSSQSNSSNSSNSSSSNSSSYNFQNSTDNPTQYQNQTYYQQTVPQGYSYQQDRAAKFYFQTQIAQVIMVGFLASGAFLSGLMSFLSSNPFSFLFLSFINFWTITSYYVMLDVGAPQYLIFILKIIFDVMNKSLFTLIGLELSYDDLFQYDDQNEQTYQIVQRFTPIIIYKFNLSSNFMDYNFQQDVIMVSSFIIILLMFLSKKFLVKKQSWLQKVLSFNYLYLSFQQFSTSVSSYCLSIYLIFQSSYSFNFNEKKNMILSSFFLCFSLCLPFFQLNTYPQQKIEKFNYQEYRKKIVVNNLFKNIQKKNSIKQKIKKQKQKIKIKIKQIYSDKVQMFYLILCNVMLPLTICLTLSSEKFQLYFFLFIFLLDCLGVYSAFICTKYRINRIIMNSYYLIFHLCFIMIWILREKFTSQDQYLEDQIAHFFGLVALGTLTIGAIHQLLFFTFQIIFSLYTLIKKVKTKFHKISIAKQNQNKLKIIHQFNNFLSNKPKKNIFEKKIADKVKKNEKKYFQNSSQNKQSYHHCKKLKKYPNFQQNYSNIQQNYKTQKVQSIQDQEQVNLQNLWTKRHEFRRKIQIKNKKKNHFLSIIKNYKNQDQNANVFGSSD